jgi:hypothetical protein
MTPLFIATEPFDAADGEKWERYREWARIPALMELVSLDGSLCPHLPGEIVEEDWNHIVCEDYRLSYFQDLGYLLRRVQGVPRRNILGLYRNPVAHITTPPGAGDFRFLGYDLLEEATQISALSNCGGFPEVFGNEELNRFGLVDAFERASEIRRLLVEHFPEELHADCELYAIWRLSEDEEIARNSK